MVESGEPVPITILGGFLGAGKTTVLNHILQAPHGRRIGVIVNDFGEMNIDAKLVVGVDGDTIDLSNGCVCCSLRDEFVASVMQMMARPNPPEHILIEASGVSDPAAIARGFDGPGLRYVVRVDAVLVVVDAEHHRRLRRAERIVAVGQLKAADIVVLNKVDRIDAAELRTLGESIQRTVARARVYPTSFGRIAPEVFFASPGPAAALAVEAHVHDHQAHDHGAHDHQAHDHGAHDHAGHDHASTFESWRFRSEVPLSPRRLRRVIENLPPQVYRAKGIVRLWRDRGRRAILHVVGRRAELELGAPWGDDPPISELVFIGTPGALDLEALRRELDGCAAPTEPFAGVMAWLRRRWA